MMFELNVSSRGLAHIPLELHDEEFEFHVSGSIHQCNMVVAEFLSPKICDLRRVDPTVREYQLDVDDPLMLFKEFLALPFKSRLQVNSDNLEFFISVARELENEELVSQLISEYFAGRELTTSTAVQYLRMKHFCGDNDEEEIAFIAQNFHNIENLSTLEIHYLRRVLAHPSLRIKSEDALYKFICRLIDEHKDPSFSELFEFVIFKFLNSKSIHDFIETSESYILDHLNLSIWRSLCDRLSQKPLLSDNSPQKQRSRYGSVIVEDEDSNASMKTEPETKSEKTNQQRRIVTVESGSGSFNGIIAYIERKHNVPITSKAGQKLIKAVASSNLRGQPQHVLKANWTDYFYTMNRPNSWFELDMKNHLVALTHYTLKSNPIGGNCFRSWIIQGSNNHSQWEVLDQRDTTDLIGGNRVKTYSVQQSTGTFYRYIRMTQTGKTSDDQDYLNLSGIEIFGQLSEPGV